ncbi:ATP-dependent RNA helicase RhlE [Ignatzschineria indica]|uniref:ATP-dependent RNA helicase RhlE n=1 Tax=Ignatzschineria indica TaxID=472583 RepID=A0A2U2AJB3_9GAMM|nr:ATP-dependent RNA helicase RhlE [Ignatzschineria indica]PWD82743.1 ATP-dependent RNA helicase RhlE [Ignatzschineria indica]GGZ86479.1 ATP-dependent RNA helicase RhlE [Ignatzschineria indica]
MSFNSLGLRDELLTAISDAGYSEPTPIQQQAIPIILKGRDLMACAQTGTGKTAGFTLPILELMSQTSVTGVAKSGQNRQNRRAVRALILSPTRELAAQIHENLVIYSRHLKLRSLVVFGGVSINPQMMKLRGGVDILVATPGRLLDLEQQNAVDLSQVEYLVLDEADRMLDMGFIHDIRRVLSKLPAKRQTLLFSATFSPEITTLATKLLHQPATVEIEREKPASEQVTQELYFVDKTRKRELLSHLIERENWQQVLVFCRTKHGANRLTEYLNNRGIVAAAIHGNKSQGARTKALADFKADALQVLVATDIAARGIDIAELPFVVNFDLPSVPADYVHRIGRTGRAAATGKAVSLVCIDEQKLLKDIERLLKKEIPKVTIAGFEPDPTIKAEPIETRRGGRGRGSSHGNSRSAGRGRGRDQSPQGRNSGEKTESSEKSTKSRTRRRANGENAGNHLGNAGSGRGESKPSSTSTADRPRRRRRVKKVEER